MFVSILHYSIDSLQLICSNFDNLCNILDVSDQQWQSSWRCWCKSPFKVAAVESKSICCVLGS